MISKYIGRSESCKHRVASITCKKGEEPQLATLCELLYEEGWKTSFVSPDTLYVEVADREEYNIFMLDYKRMKREIKFSLRSVNIKDKVYQASKNMSQNTNKAAAICVYDAMMQYNTLLPSQDICELINKLK